MTKLLVPAMLCLLFFATAVFGGEKSGFDYNSPEATAAMEKALASVRR